MAKTRKSKKTHVKLTRGDMHFIYQFGNPKRAAYHKAKRAALLEEHGYAA